MDNMMQIMCSPEALLKLKPSEPTHMPLDISSKSTIEIRDGKIKH